MITIDEFNEMDASVAKGLLQDCCASREWNTALLASRPYTDLQELLQRADQVWSDLSEKDYLEAFDAHPRIGDPDSLKARYGSTRNMAEGEQSGMQTASDKVINELADLNNRYYDQFGFIFIVCATGKSARQMLELIKERVYRDRDAEVVTAAEEQRKITEIRLRNLFG